MKSLTRRFQYTCKLSDDLWRRWTSDYLLSLREGAKPRGSTRGLPPPRVDDVVLIQDEGPRMLWKLGRITQLLTGVDGQIRVARLKTANGITTRPIVKLYPLEGVVITPSLDENSTNNPNSPIQPGGDDVQPSGRPSRRAALGSTQLWRDMIGEGLL